MPPAAPDLPTSPTPTPAAAYVGLPRATLAAYALPSVGPMFLYNLILVMYLNFATDHLGAAPGAVGLLFFLAKAWDGVSDPLAGALSDRTRTRLGRRRPWLLASAVPLALFSIMAWAPPQGLSGPALVTWISVAIFGFYTAYTAFDVPHMALGAELTVADGRGRNRLYAWRQMLRTLGMLAAFGVGTAVVADPESGRQGAFVLALVAGAVTVTTLAYGVLSLPPERPDFVARGGQRPFRAVGDVLRNPHARLLLAVFFVESMGTGAIGVLVPYSVRYVMELPTSFIPAVLLTYVAATLVGIPIWVRLASRFEKRHLWLFAMVQGGLGFGLLLFVGKGDWPLAVVASFIAGSAGACGNTLGQSLKADVIDVDELRTGERKEGAYFAAWSLVGKLAGGLMVGVVGVTLDALGYVENVPQTETVRRAMVWLMGGMPLLGYGIGTVLFARFRLTQAEHARIRAELDARAAAARS